MKKHFSLLLIVMMVMSCSMEDEKQCLVNGRLPEIFPDYIGVTIPANVAPMNFSVLESGSFLLKISVGQKELVLRSKGDGSFDIPLGKWKKLMYCSEGQELKFSVLREEGKCLEAYEPFSMKVAPEPADPYIAYRLIPPGYVAWKEMGIYQRCIENFKQSAIVDNRRTDGNCVNCHSFCMQDPGRMIFHSRSTHAGTMVYTDEGVEKLNTKTPQTISPLVYPYWHPSGKYVAFSNNDTHQAFFINHPNMIEVFDNASDIVVYNVEQHSVSSSPLIKSSDSFETFPTFSPDGGRLYFCTAQSVDSVRDHYKDVRYSLCSIGFNPEDGTFSDTVDTLFNARTTGKSASFPRISPDGRFLVFTLHSFGNFSIWHHDADLWCIDLNTSDSRPLSAANSNDTESYHSWSHNGRWLVFSSRRLDGLYTRPYFTYIDSLGNAAKPFLLPQKKPLKYYEDLQYSYNIPEFINGKVDVNSIKTANDLKHLSGIDIIFK